MYIYIYFKINSPLAWLLLVLCSKATPPLWRVGARHCRQPQKALGGPFSCSPPGAGKESSQQGGQNSQGRPWHFTDFLTISVWQHVAALIPFHPSEIALGTEANLVPTLPKNVYYTGGSGSGREVQKASLGL